MTPFFLQLFKRPWQWLLLLLVGTPLAWAAGAVSINNLVITTVQQLSFAQSKAEVNVNQQFTQTATARLSPGAVTYRSSDTAVATVNAQTGQVTGVLSGEATITASQVASPPYPAASASYTIKVKGLPLIFQPWQLASVMYGMPAFQVTPPSSNVQNATIVYRLKDPATSVASITETGLVTVKAVGKTTIVATQKPLGLYDGGSVEAELEVMAVPGLNDRELPYTTAPIDLLPQLGGQNVTYSSSTPGVATIIGTSGQPQVSLKGVLGNTVLEAKNAAGIVMAKATWKVVAGQPTLTVDPVPPLPSTTFETTLRAISSNTLSPITFSIPDANQAENIAEINPTTGHLWVKGPGTAQVKVSQAANGPWAAAEVTVPVPIEKGNPGIVITSWPQSAVQQGGTFRIGYRTNFVKGQITGYIALQGDIYFSDSRFTQVSQPTPALGQESFFEFRLDDPATPNGTYKFVTAQVKSPFTVLPWSTREVTALSRDIQVNGVVRNLYNLGPPITMVYGEKPVMPKSYYRDGGEVTDNNRCTEFEVLGNPGVLEGIGLGPQWDKDSWKTVGVGQTVIGCAKYDYDPVVVTVIGADPQLQGFPPVTIGMDSSFYALHPAASLNPTGTWSYQIVPMPGEPDPVARIVNGQIQPLTPGKAILRATQSAGSNFREASIEAVVTVKSAQDRSFTTIRATYGDPDFLIPRPTGYADSVSFTYEAVSPSQDVFEIRNGTTLGIRNANTDTSGNVTTPATIRARGSDGSTIEGQVIVAKATPQLLFYFPPGLYFSSVCGETWKWPVANQGTANKVNGTLITNSDAVPYYPMGTEAGTFGWKGPNQFHPYYERYMMHGSYTPEMAQWQEAWVDLPETRNFLSAQSAKIRYSIWGNDRVAWINSTQSWMKSCDQ